MAVPSEWPQDAAAAAASAAAAGRAQRATAGEAGYSREQIHEMVQPA
jgi:hypothetical protein